MIELIVVLMLSSILAAIALPSFLQQANKAKQVEAKIHISSLNRAQQAYILQYFRFTNDLQQLGIAPQKNANYRYSIDLDETGSAYAAHHAESIVSTLHSYTGMTGIQRTGNDTITTSIVCESQRPSVGKATAPIYTESSLSCAPGTTSLE